MTTTNTLTALAALLALGACHKPRSPAAPTLGGQPLSAFPGLEEPMRLEVLERGTRWTTRARVAQAAGGQADGLQLPSYA